MSINPSEVYQEPTASGATAKMLADNVMEIPIRYMGSNVTIRGTLVSTNSEWLLENVEVVPTE